MAGKGGKKDSKGGVIVKKFEVVEGGHHGGAWKVAYADFVTAMMAFFLLMWLLNATTEDQRKGLADYFSPNNLMSHASSGTGQPFGGHTAFDQGALVSDRGSVLITAGKRPVIDRTEDGDDPIYSDYHRAKSGDGQGAGPMPDDQDADDSTSDKPLGQSGTRLAPGPGGPSVVQRDGQPDAGPATPADVAAQPDVRPVTPADVAAEKAREEKASFEQAAQQITAAVQSDPTLAGLAKQLTIDMTPEGLRIQLLDEVKLPMFPTGSSTPNDRVRLLLQKVVPVLLKLKEPISIAGHTDAAPFPGPDRTNWELSAERANATRRLLVEDGLPDARVKSVIGDADRDPLLPADPLAAANRRIAILVQRQAAPVPTGAAAAATP
ncbi:flagellar motor protein MotB [Acidisphaera sp. S103]|uniref:flagellar motor protein MotB n=1 Tax=Acidisphaera sp. S103 TaxID=1747223 RepID=UPI00131E513F|nr:flagellar motor protein MotB [Acidisphaera sp. S103]